MTELRRSHTEDEYQILSERADELQQQFEHIETLYESLLADNAELLERNSLLELDLAKVEEISTQLADEMSYSKIPTLPSLLGGPEDFPDWDGYLKDQMQITEIKGAEEYSVWDIVSGEFAAPTTPVKQEGESRSGKESDAQAKERRAWN